MELASAHLHKGQVPWVGLLLTASLLASWSPATTAEVTIEAVPPQVAEDNNVLLLVHNLPLALGAFAWYKGNTTAIDKEIARFVPNSNMNFTGQAYSGREIIYSNGSLLFQMITMKDMGVYTLDMTDENYRRTQATVRFHVHQPVTQPFLQVTNTTVKELDSVTLTCLSNDIGANIQWLFNSQSLQLTERMTLSQNNSILRIDPIKREDAGEYQCEISNPVSVRRSNSIKLDIIFDPTQGGLSDGAIAGIVIGVVAGVALIAGLAYFLYSRKSGGGSDQRDLTEHKPSASNHNLAPSDNSPNKDLTMQPWQPLNYVTKVGLELWPYTCLSLSCAGMTSVCYHTKLRKVFLKRHNCEIQYGSLLLNTAQKDRLVNESHESTTRVCVGIISALWLISGYDS